MRYFLLDYWTNTDEPSIFITNLQEAIKNHFEKRNTLTLAQTKTPEITIVEPGTEEIDLNTCSYTPLAKKLIQKYNIDENCVIISYGVSSSQLAQEICTLQPIAALILQELCSDQRTEVLVEHRKRNLKNCEVVVLYDANDNRKSSSIQNALENQAGIFKFHRAYKKKSGRKGCYQEGNSSFETIMIPKFIVEHTIDYLDWYYEQGNHQDLS